MHTEYGPPVVLVVEVPVGSPRPDSARRTKSPPRATHVARVGLDHDGEGQRQARWHLHFTPTSSSWLNLIERWFKELTDKRLRRGVFTSVADLTEAITAWAEHWNTDPRPFAWKATAEDIIAKVAARGRAALHQLKTTTDH